jgi:hypothetical protein
MKTTKTLKKGSKNNKKKFLKNEKDIKNNNISPQHNCPSQTHCRCQLFVCAIDIQHTSTIITKSHMTKFYKFKMPSLKKIPISSWMRSTHVGGFL